MLAERSEVVKPMQERTAHESDPSIALECLDQLAYRLNAEGWMRCQITAVGSVDRLRLSIVVQPPLRFDRRLVTENVSLSAEAIEWRRKRIFPHDFVELFLDPARIGPKYGKWRETFDASMNETLLCGSGSRVFSVDAANWQSVVRWFLEGHRQVSFSCVPILPLAVGAVYSMAGILLRTTQVDEGRGGLVVVRADCLGYEGCGMHVVVPAAAPLARFLAWYPSVKYREPRAPDRAVPGAVDEERG